MSFIFRCPHCETEQRAANSLVGRRVRCPGCDHIVEVSAAHESQDLGEAPEAEQRRAEESLEQVRASLAAAERPAEAPRFRGAPEAPPEPKVDFRTGRAPLVDGEMDMTPMVDVTFNLLIFFMVTAAFSLQKSIEVPKPQQSDQPSTVVMEIEDNPDYVTIIVDEFSTFQVMTPEWERECPSEQELLIQLREAKRGSGGAPPTKVLVKAHGDAIHERVVMALDASSAVKFEEIQLASFEDE